MNSEITSGLRYFRMKEMESLGIESKNSNVVERLDSSCNKRWKGYSYVEEYMEIILFSILSKWEVFGLHMLVGLSSFLNQAEF